MAGNENLGDEEVGLQTSELGLGVRGTGRFPPVLCGHSNAHPRLRGHQEGGPWKVTAIAFNRKANNTRLEWVSDAKLEPEVTYLKRISVTEP